MPAVVYTRTKPAALGGSIPDGVPGKLKVVYRDITADTGTYTTAGASFGASLFNLKKIVFVSVSGSVATTGTSGVTANAIGITYAADGTSFTLQLYEGSAAGTALSEKTSAEALEANFTIRLRIEGY